MRAEGARETRQCSGRRLGGARLVLLPLRHRDVVPVLGRRGLVGGLIGLGLRGLVAVDSGADCADSRLLPPPAAAGAAARALLWRVALGAVLSTERLVRDVNPRSRALVCVRERRLDRLGPRLGLGL